MDIYKLLSQELASDWEHYRIREGTVAVPRRASTKLRSRARKNPLLLTRPDSQGLLLNKYEAFIWRELERGKAVSEIGVDFFLKFNHLGGDFVDQALSTWLKLGFLERSEDLATEIDSKLADSSKSWGWLGLHSRSAWLRPEIGISGPRLERFFEQLQDAIQLFLRAQTLILIGYAAIVGILAFFATGGGSARPALTELLALSPGWSLVLSLVLAVFFVIWHEFGHALSLKSFKLPVTRAGFRFYLGYPVFYVDTTASWSLPTSQRIAVASAGMIANLLLSGIIAWTIIILEQVFLVSVNSTLIALLVQSLWLNLYLVVVNLIPVVELDGYYILSDILNEPNLRAESLTNLWLFISGQKSPVRPLHFSFGIIAVMGSIWFLSLSANFWASLLLN